ncbi:MAG TPA: hypothetical protein VE641_12230 [Chthoniobacterales bacterium]|nr:hypothetical protein [Chthoniobacterales bacterium]
MDEHTLLTIFVGLAALAMLIQAGTLLGLFIVAKRIQEKVSVLTGPITSILDTSKKTLQMVEGHIDRIGTSSNAILDTTKQQLAKVDELLTDASTRAKVQMERAEMVLDDTMGRVQHTVSFVQSGVIRPVREVQGIVTGIRTAITHLGRGGRPTVDHATADEEMFI